MRSKIIVAMLAFLITIPGIAAAAEIENYIQVKGEASIIAKPDIAHCFMIVTGEGESYETSNKAANDKLAQLREVLKTTLQETPALTILKTENKPKAKSFDGKEYFTEMAKAVKGESPAKTETTKKEMTTAITVYFSLSKFSKESILKLMSSLSEKEITFDKGSRFDFGATFEYMLGKSAIYYGLTSTDKQLEILAAEAFNRAEHDAKIIAPAIKKRLVGLINVTGCGDLMEGDVTIPFKSNLTGKNLGPLSSDPSRLMIKFSKDFGFKIQ